MKEKKKILILGSDFGTYDIACEAKKMGLYVITADLMETSPTKQVSDEAWLVSTTDYDTLERKCAENHIGGILFGASDFNISNARILCKRLNLPTFCPDDKAWNISKDKYEFKKACEEAGAPIATNYRISDELKREDLEKIKYPVVIKPVDMSGNRGMSYCDNEDELIEAYKFARSISQNPNIICERRLFGKEWDPNYLILNGNPVLLGFMQEFHQPGEAANLYSMIVTTSYGLKTWLEETNDKVKTLFNHIGFVNGVAWVETILDKDGHFYLLEPGHRFDSMTNYKLYEKMCGFNIIQWYINLALGIQISQEKFPRDLTGGRRDCIGSYHLFANKDGIIDSIEGLDKLLEMNDVDIDLPKRKGGAVKYHSNIGLIRVYGKSVEEMVNKFEYINSVFSIRDNTGENLFIRFTDFDSVIRDFHEGLAEFNV